MKKLLLIFLLCFTSLFAFSQTSNVNQIKKELARSQKKISKLKKENSVLERTNTDLKDTILKITNENLYFRKSLHILTPIKTANLDKVVINLLSCIGNKQEQTVTLTFSFISTDFNKRLQFLNGDFRAGKQLAIDVQGNSYNSDNVKGSTGKYTSEIFVNTPVKATVKFEGVPSSVLMLKHVKLYMISVDKHANITNLYPHFTDARIRWK